jgi:ribonuclease VapC
MTTIVDASALLAILQDEDGANYAAARLRGALLSSVNFAEVLAKASDREIARDAVELLLTNLQIVVVPFGHLQAELSADLRVSTRYKNVSLADRACLALAIEHDAPVLSADTKWVELGLPVDIRLIR